MTETVPVTAVAGILALTDSGAIAQQIIGAGSWFDSIALVILAGIAAEVVTSKAAAAPETALSFLIATTVVPTPWQSLTQAFRRLSARSSLWLTTVSPFAAGARFCRACSACSRAALAC
jgi:hypothetical protein